MCTSVKISSRHDNSISQYTANLPLVFSAVYLLFDMMLLSTWSNSRIWQTVLWWFSTGYIPLRVTTFHLSLQIEHRRAQTCPTPLTIFQVTTNQNENCSYVLHCVIFKKNNLLILFTKDISPCRKQSNFLNIWTSFWLHSTKPTNVRQLCMLCFPWSKINVCMTELWYYGRSFAAFLFSCTCKIA